MFGAKEATNVTYSVIKVLRNSHGAVSEEGGHWPPERTLSTSSSVRGHVVRFSHPSAVTKTSSSRRTPPVLRNRLMASGTRNLLRSGLAKASSRRTLIK